MALPGIGQFGIPHSTTLMEGQFVQHVQGRIRQIEMHSNGHCEAIRNSKRIPLIAKKSFPFFSSESKFACFIKAHYFVVVQSNDDAYFIDFCVRGLGGGRDGILSLKNDAATKKLFAHLEKSKKLERPNKLVLELDKNLSTLLLKGADVNATKIDSKTGQSYTPLSLVAEKGDWLRAAILLDHGARCEEAPVYFRTAYQANELEVCAALLKAGAKLENVGLTVRDLNHALKTQSLSKTNFLLSSILPNKEAVSLALAGESEAIASKVAEAASFKWITQQHIEQLLEKKFFALLSEIFKQKEIYLSIFYALDCRNADMLRFLLRTCKNTSSLFDPKKCVRHDGMSAIDLAMQIPSLRIFILQMICLGIPFNSQCFFQAVKIDLYLEYFIESIDNFSELIEDETGNTPLVCSMRMGRNNKLLVSLLEKNAQVTTQALLHAKNEEQALLLLQYANSKEDLLNRSILMEHAIRNQWVKVSHWLIDTSEELDFIPAYLPYGLRSSIFEKVKAHPRFMPILRDMANDILKLLPDAIEENIKEQFCEQLQIALSSKAILNFLNNNVETAAGLFKFTKYIAGELAELLRRGDFNVTNIAKPVALLVIDYTAQMNKKLEKQASKDQHRERKLQAIEKQRMESIAIRNVMENTAKDMEQRDAAEKQLKAQRAAAKKQDSEKVLDALVAVKRAIELL